MLFNKSEQRYGSTDQAASSVSFCWHARRNLAKPHAERVEEGDTNDSITSRSAYYLSTPVSQMWETNLRHVQDGDRAWAVLVCVLARWRQAPLRLYRQGSANGGAQAGSRAGGGFAGAGSGFFSGLRRFCSPGSRPGDAQAALRIAFSWSALLWNAPRFFARFSCLADCLIPQPVV
jgi:hypothetical protein